MPLVEVKDLAYQYPDGTVALRGLNLAIDDGESVGIVGPNGAGKSTLLWHLNGLLPEHPSKKGQGGGPQNNQRGVHVAGWCVEAANLPDIRRAVGLLFQDPDDQLFCPTVGEDVAFGPLNLGLSSEEVAQRVRTALSEVEMAEEIDRVPHRLSVGERKRVCLAGVLACHPRLLALDEPSASLDPRSRRKLIEILARLGSAKLIATHDLELVLELCPRTMLLDHGSIVADGPSKTLLADEDLLRQHGLEPPYSLRPPDES